MIKNKCKKLISIAMLLVMMASMFSVNVFADGLEYEGSCGENVRYSFNESTGELVIFGEGEMDNYNNWNLLPWEEYKDKIKSVKIEENVTSIGYSAFSGCKRLTSVNIPNSVTSIGDWAFTLCGILTSVTIPASVTTIGEWAFMHCTNLTSVTIPDSVTTIGKWAFRYCTNLQKIKISPESTLKDEELNLACGENAPNIGIIRLIRLIWCYKKINNLNELVGYEDGDICSICLGFFEAGNEVSELFCQANKHHCYHRECFEEYLKGCQKGNIFKCLICNREYDK